MEEKQVRKGDIVEYKEMMIGLTRGVVIRINPKTITVHNEKYDYNVRIRYGYFNIIEQ